MNKPQPSTLFLKRLLCLLIAAALISCLSRMDINRERTVLPSNRILLNKGELQRGIWKSPNVDFDYAYRLKKQALELSGNVFLKEATLQGGARKVRFITLTAYLLDDTGNILSYHVVLSWNLPGKTYEWSVSQTLDLPKDCTAIAFGYTGQVTDGKKEGTILDLYYNPTSELSISDK